MTALWRIPRRRRRWVAILEEEFGRISFQLGCRAEERIVTIVQSREAYLKNNRGAGLERRRL